MLVAILLLIEFTNLAKADNQADKNYNYDSYQYPDYNRVNISTKIAAPLPLGLWRPCIDNI